MPSVRVGGHRIAYERAGAGPPVVLLHGGISDHREWRRQMAALSDGFDVVAWDAPGCGRSSDPAESSTIDDYADALAGLVAALGLGRPHVAGLSWGGGLAIALAHRHPDVPASLTVMGGYAGWAGSLPAEVVEARLRSCLHESRLPAERWAPGWIPGLLSEGAPDELVREVLEIMRGVHPVGYRAMARSFAAADLRDALPDIALPTLLIYGELDRRAPPSVGAAIAARIPGARMVVVPGVGHMVNMEAPEAVAAELRAFFERAGPPPATPRPRPSP